MAPRVPMTLSCRLMRGLGPTVTAHTIDVGMGGMLLCASRPLEIGEMLRFELASDVGDAAHEHAAVGGRARVVREQALTVYALTFERFGRNDMPPRRPDAFGGGSVD